LAKVAFLGLGVMGYPMAGHLKNKGGHDVTVYNRSQSKAAKWVAEYGGALAETPAKAAEGKDFVFACVGNDDDLRSVTTALDGAFSAMKEGAIFIDNTTASAEVARELAAAADKGGFGFVDAPVSGGQACAENGVLTVMCGGEQAHFDKAKPVIDVYAKMCALIGGPGAGQLTKMVNQICIVGLAQALAEGMAFAKRNELDLEKVVSVISKGAAQSWQMENRWKQMSELKAEGFGFAIEWMRKDMGICLAQAKRSGARLPVAALVDQFYAHLEARGGKVLWTGKAEQVLIGDPASGTFITVPTVGNASISVTKSSGSEPAGNSDTVRFGSAFEHTARASISSPVLSTVRASSTRSRASSDARR
jgi:3-hydroxyisobutyrate dehydrogenase